ncbi:MAG: peptidoglycan-binding protein [Scytonema sp. PMC 1069.18]|nr:peptidoglycan-binding protein [Scytonema sp. PMC 1069.18]MEC4887020.1 peptidoglycan-binding protein [Scytonema sp. PMC 1070.18]
MQSPSETTDAQEEIVQIQVSKPVLREGSKGRAVEELQNLLTHRGAYTGPINGVYEEQTEEGVKNFQKRVFLKPDGIVAKHTWTSLYSGAPVDMPELSRGSHGELVMTVQRVLKSTMDYVGIIDGDFGELTEASVTSLQRRNNLPVTGVVSEQTWLVLSKVPR